MLPGGATLQSLWKVYYTLIRCSVSLDKQRIQYLDGSSKQVFLHVRRRMAL